MKAFKFHNYIVCKEAFSTPPEIKRCPQKKRGKEETVAANTQFIKANYSHRFFFLLEETN